tara:strand:+ start:1036 stop:1623 length:588 start_codon:yes stop_codon:yes gene_type:complete
MKISASIQAANQLNLLEDIENNNDKFDQLHIDITDGNFAENISMSFKIIEQLKNTTDYFLDVHLMINENLKYGRLAFDCGADFVTVHKESTNLQDFIELSDFNKNLGVGLLPASSNTDLNEYLEHAHSVLLLGVNPGFSNQDPVVDLSNKVNDFKLDFPNYSGQVIVDGGIKNEDLDTFKKMGVDIVVQGGAIFG